jgi:hypothetical protein
MAKESLASVTSFLSRKQPEPETEAEPEMQTEPEAKPQPELQPVPEPEQLPHQVDVIIF